MLNRICAKISNNKNLDTNIYHTSIGEENNLAPFSNAYSAWVEVIIPPAQTVANSETSLICSTIPSIEEIDSIDNNYIVNKTSLEDYLWYVKCRRFWQ